MEVSEVIEPEEDPAEVYQLAYVSRSCIDPDPEILGSALKDILRTANRFNSKHQITGTLVYSEGFFCQVIEGEGDTIAELFNRIQHDPRHVNCKLVSYKPVAARMFPKWAMKFGGASEVTSIHIDRVLAFENPLNESHAGFEVIDDLLNRMQRSARLNIYSRDS